MSLNNENHRRKEPYLFLPSLNCSQVLVFCFLLSFPWNFLSAPSAECTLYTETQGPTLPLLEDKDVSKTSCMQIPTRSKDEMCFSSIKMELRNTWHWFCSYIPYLNQVYIFLLTVLHQTWVLFYRMLIVEIHEKSNLYISICEITTHAHRVVALH